MIAILTLTLTLTPLQSGTGYPAEIDWQKLPTRIWQKDVRKISLRYQAKALGIGIPSLSLIKNHGGESF